MAAGAIAQMPPPTPGSLPAPAAVAGSPAVPAVPAASEPAQQRPNGPSEPPLRRYEPLVAWPFATQSAVRGALGAGEWLVRRQQPHGRFLYGFNPALRQPLAGDDELAQAHAAWAVAECAAFSGEERQAVAAAQAILALLSLAPPDPSDPQVRLPPRGWTPEQRLQFAAVLVLAIHRLPQADNRLLEEAERLCAFIRQSCDGEGADAAAATGGAGSDAGGPSAKDVAGDASADVAAAWGVAALATSYRLKPAAWKGATVNAALARCRKREVRSIPPAAAVPLILAASQWYLQTQQSEAAACVFTLADSLCTLQIAVTDPRLPQWAGGFRQVQAGVPRDAVVGPEMGLYVAAVAQACLLSRHLPDLPRYRRYAPAAIDAVRHLAQRQYSESNTRHFENNFRAYMLIGGVHLSPEDGNLRIDAAAHAVIGFLRFLESRAEE